MGMQTVNREEEMWFTLFKHKRVLEHVQGYRVNFMVAPCINNITNFIVQKMHTNYKILRLLK